MQSRVLLDQNMCWGSDAYVIDDYGNSNYISVNERTVGIRVALPYSEISKIASSEVKGADGIIQLEAGYLPKKIASKQLQKDLERVYDFLQGYPKSIHKKYTVDSRDYDDYVEKFDPKQLDEIELPNGADSNIFR